MPGSLDERVLRAERRVGRVLSDKWRLDSLIGLGGMAAVYAATHTNNLREAAIKVLHREFSASDDMRRRFLREGYIANKVGHPGVVSILDDGIDEDGSVFLVMELFHGETLQARAKKTERRLESDVVLALTEKLLDVLAAAHDAGVVHRDLKPENIFLTETGEVKVLDFGIARLNEPRGTLATQAGALVGTPAYMPPEQVAGKMDQIDARTDIWAVGAIMFTLLTGEYVHDVKSANALLLAAMSSPARKLQEVMPTVSPALAKVVDRALAYEQSARWQDARDMQAAIREAMVQGPVIAFRKSEIIVSEPSEGRRRAGTFIAALFGLLLGASLAFVAWSRRDKGFPGTRQSEMDGGGGSSMLARGGADGGPGEGGELNAQGQGSLSSGSGLDGGAQDAASDGGLYEDDDAGDDDDGGYDDDEDDGGLDDGGDDDEDDDASLAQSGGTGPHAHAAPSSHSKGSVKRSPVRRPIKHKRHGTPHRRPRW